MRACPRRYPDAPSPAYGAAAGRGGETAGNLSFTHERSLNGLRLNRFLYRLIEPAWRERFLQSPQSLYAEAGLSEEEQQLLNARDWRGLIQYGASFFLLEKMGAVVGVSNLHIYAAMRGQTLEAFQQTRNQQVTYSVAGKR